MKKSGLVFLGAVCGFIGLFIFLAGIGPEWNRTNPPKWNKTKSFGKNDINNDDSLKSTMMEIQRTARLINLKANAAIMILNLNIR